MTSTRDTARTDPRVTRTRRLIEDAFLEVLQEKGFEDLSVQDVTERAGINRVTFYSHFVDRYALLRSSVRKAFEAEIEQRGLAERELRVASVRDLFLAVCEYIDGMHQHCKPPHDHLDWIVGDVITDSSAELFVRWSAARGKAAPRSFLESATAAGSSLHALAARRSRMKKRAAPGAFVESTLPIVTAILGLAEADSRRAQPRLARSAANHRSSRSGFDVSRD
ncbi:MAG TPA: TetR/AcrR family transcriptional regulator [Spirochaetia bacterium]|nr:TetR/AcrR family transcriptional regulator [Spirochaetia bacterium]